MEHREERRVEYMNTRKHKLDTQSIEVEKMKMQVAFGVCALHQNTSHGRLANWGFIVKGVFGIAERKNVKPCKSQPHRPDSPCQLQSVTDKDSQNYVTQPNQSMRFVIVYLNGRVENVWKSRNYPQIEALNFEWPNLKPCRHSQIVSMSSSCAHQKNRKLEREIVVIESIS